MVPCRLVPIGWCGHVTNSVLVPNSPLSFPSQEEQTYTSALAAGGVAVCPEQASHPKKGLQGFPRPPRPAAPPTAQRPPGPLEVREVLPARPSVVSSPWCSPPSTLLPPSVDSSCRCCCFGCCVIRPRAARTEGLGPGTPWPPPARPPALTLSLPAPETHPGLLSLTLPGFQLPRLSPAPPGCNGAAPPAEPFGCPLSLGSSFPCSHLRPQTSALGRPRCAGQMD